MRSRFWAPALAVVTLGFPLAAAPALAQPASDQTTAAPEDSERLALARQLISVMHAEASLDRSFRQIFNQSPSAFQGPAKANSAEVAHSLGVGFQSVVPEMVDRMAHIYGRVFTSDELRAAIAFYTSPAGQSFMAKAPDVAKETWPMTMALMPKVVAAAERDYCARRTCSEAEHTAFQKMAAAVGGAS